MARLCFVPFDVPPRRTAKNAEKYPVRRRAATSAAFGASRLPRAGSSRASGNLSEIFGSLLSNAWGCLGCLGLLVRTSGAKDARGPETCQTPHRVMAFDSPFDGLALRRSVENSRVLKSLARPAAMPRSSVLT